MKKCAFIAGASLLACGAALADAPAVSSVTLAYDEPSRTVSVDYTLENAPAVITVEFRTNGVAIAEKAYATVEGDVNRLISTSGSHQLAWSLADSGLNVALPKLTATVTAWATDHPPLYMVVDCARSKADGGIVRYYTSTNALPGGLLENLAYRQSSIVLRRIDAKGVKWSFGSGLSAFDVTLTNDYYIGVFELTQSQYLCISKGYAPNYFNGADWRDMRPVETVQYGGHLRGYGGSYWPDPPGENQFLGKARTLTGIDFDLPGEAQWEFACRAGNSASVLNDGSSNTIANKNRLARHKTNGGYIGGTTVPSATTPPSEGGTAIVGSYAPNSWGLYDMNGNVWEWCLDWYQDMATIKVLAGAINSTTNAAPISGSASGRVRRGGGWSSGDTSQTPTVRDQCAQYSSGNNLGLRLVCPAIAK